MARFQPCLSCIARCLPARAPYTISKDGTPEAVYIDCGHRGKPWPHSPTSLSNQGGAHFYPSYNLARDKEILHVRIRPVSRSSKTGLLLSLVQEAMNQPVDYLLCLLTDENTSCTELLNMVGGGDNSGSLSRCFRKQSLTVEGCSCHLMVPTLQSGK